MGLNLRFKVGVVGWTISCKGKVVSGLKMEIWWVYEGGVVERSVRWD